MDDTNDRYFLGKSTDKLNRKIMYSLIMKNEEPTRVEQFWSKKNITLDKKHWLMPFKCTKETRLHILQWKILHNIYPTAIMLNKMGVVDSINCKTCGVTEFSEHFFFQCNSTRQLWEEVEKTILYTQGVNIKLDITQVMTGYYNKSKSSEETIDKINHIILIAKMVISKAKYGKTRNMALLLQHELYVRGFTPQRY